MDSSDQEPWGLSLYDLQEERGENTMTTPHQGGGPSPKPGFTGVTPVTWVTVATGISGVNLRHHVNTLNQVA